MSKKNTELTLEEAIQYCWDNLNTKTIGEDLYHKYRVYKRRYLKGDTLSYNALHNMFKDFGITTDCRYYLPKK